jgi:aminopyrrolnitrin oxygenase
VLQVAQERDGSFDFPACPQSWFHVCGVEELRRGPVGVNLAQGGSFVAFRTDKGQIVVASARCCHAGSNLAEGSVVGENIRCPLHGWEFGPDGMCRNIPTGDAIPAWARQRIYPAEEIGGHVFFFNRAKANFPLPFYEGVDPSKLVAAEPFELVVEAPWYIASSNGFDLQHFRFSHDRKLVGEPVISSPAEYSRRIVADFEVVGHSWRDQLTRAFSGPRVKMEVTDWCGNFILVRAQFRRTTSYGLMTSRPLENNRTLARVIVFVERSGWRLLDRMNAAIRRDFIRAFLRPDVERTAGLVYHRKRFIESDRTLCEYLDWLEGIHKKGSSS